MYLDAPYIVRLYIADPGAAEVRALVKSASTVPACVVRRLLDLVI
jgi:hypothetical protein